VEEKIFVLTVTLDEAEPFVRLLSNSSCFLHIL
jgi:hypothetical protein